MGRIRTVKPEFFTDEELSSLAEITHLFAAGLLCYADDEGYFNANEGLVKAAIFPLRECSVSVHDMLTHLVGTGYLCLGVTSDGKRWGRVVNFSIHQRVNRPTPSKISNLHIKWEGVVITHPQLTEDSLPEGKGREGKGTGNRDALPDSVDTRILSESVGIFGMREQADMNRLLAVHMKESGRKVGQAIEWMIGQWESYKQAVPMLEYDYGSSYKFFMSGKWNSPEIWPRKDKPAQQKPRILSRPESQ